MKRIDGLLEVVVNLAFLVAGLGVVSCVAWEEGDYIEEIRLQSKESVPALTKH